jgi:hypothetical protein
MCTTKNAPKLPTLRNRPPGSFQRKNNGLPGHSLKELVSGQEADTAADLHLRCFYAGNYREALFLHERYRGSVT